MPPCEILRGKLNLHVDVPCIFQLVYCLTIGAYGRDGDLVLGLTAALAWELPNKVDSKISNLLHRRSRSVVYPKMEAFLQSWVSCRYFAFFNRLFPDLSACIRIDAKRNPRLECATVFKKKKLLFRSGKSVNANYRARCLQTKIIMDQLWGFIAAGRCETAR